MGILEELANDLSQFNIRYKSSLPLKNIALAASGSYEEEMERSGKIVIEFYNNIFIPRYSKIKYPLIQKTGIIMNDAATRAEKYLGEGRYDGIGMLFNSKDVNPSRKNVIDNLVDEIKKYM